MKYYIAILVAALFSATLHAKVVEIELTIAETPVNFTGRTVQAMTINGGIPGPTLRFTEGDVARITVRNAMREETSIHWHGLLVPNVMDGVPHVTMPPIAPGGVFHYEFRLRQAGTYWYHSHTVLQEQRGVYGAIVIAPRGGEKVHADRDFVVVLGDWTDEQPREVLRTLRRGSDYYSLKKGTAQSIVGAAQAGALGAYFQREWSRMPPMDLSDVAYDRFLVNGQPEQTLAARPGERVRLRVINAAAATYFHLGWAGGPMRVVAADGQGVQPVALDRFLMPIAETYDMVLTVPASGAAEFRATAQDGTGRTSLFIGSGQRLAAPDVPKPNIYASMAGMKMDAAPAMDAMPGMKMPAPKPKPAMRKMEGMNHSATSAPLATVGVSMADMPGMKMPAAKKPAAKAAAADDMADMKMPAKRKPAATDDSMADMPGMKMPADSMAAMPGMKPGAMNMDDPARPNAPYAQLRSVRRTTLPAGRPVRDYTFRLQGDMIRYVWFLDGKTLTEADTINIRHGETVRFRIVNETMMHHPMHLHGHFFRVLNGAGDFSPLKHTVDVPPMSEQTIEFAADESGDWMFHCHILYHAKVGMARVVHYEGSPPNPHLAQMDKTEHDPIFLWGEGTAMTHMSDGFLTLQNNRNGLTAAWSVGWQNVEKTDYEIELTYDRYLTSFLSVFAGADITNEDAGNRGILGVRYLLPLNVGSSAWVDTNGDFRFRVEKTFQITSRLAAFGGAEYDTRSRWQTIAGAEYTLNKQLSLITQWHSDFGFGAGVSIRF